jgi:hypothetical protein
LEGKKSGACVHCKQHQGGSKRFYKSKEAQQSDAVDFAEWMGKMGYCHDTLNGESRWVIPEFNILKRLTTTEMYKLFKDGKHSY